MRTYRSENQGATLAEISQRSNYRFRVPDAGTFWYHLHTNETVQLEVIAAYIAVACRLIRAHRLGFRDATSAQVSLARG